MIPVKLSPVKQMGAVEKVQVAGTVAASDEIRMSFKVAGLVRKVYVREGQSVRKGQLLAELDLTEINAQVNQANYQFEKSGRDLKRTENMLRDTAATLEQLENAKTAFDYASQSVEIAKFNQQYAKILAPINGTISHKLISEGEISGIGIPALVMASSGKNNWVVRVNVSDKDWGRLKVGNVATVTLDAYPDAILKGHVLYIAQSADPVNKLYQIEVQVDPAGKHLASGLYAKVVITPVGSTSYTVIPVEALIEGDGNTGFVFVKKGNLARQIPIKIGYLEGGSIYVTDGLDGYDQVISAGSAFLTDSSVIKVLP